jgi:hypothetical protein
MDPKATVNTRESERQDAPATNGCLAAETAPEPICMPENRLTLQRGQTSLNAIDGSLPLSNPRQRAFAPLP